MTKLGASSRDAGRTLAPSLTFSMVASSDTSYTTHTTLACRGGHVAQHYQRLPVHATPALRQDTVWLRDPGSHPSLALLSQCPLAVSLGWSSAVQTSHRPSLRTSRSQHCDSGQQAPEGLRADTATPETWYPDLASVRHSLSLWAEKMTRAAPLGHSSSCRGTGQGRSERLPPGSLAQTHVLPITGNRGLCSLRPWSGRHGSKAQSSELRYRVGGRWPGHRAVEGVI